MNGPTIQIQRAAIMISRVCVILLGALVLSGCTHNPRAVPGAHSEIIDSLPEAVRSLPVRIIPSYEHPVLAWSTAGMMDRYVSYNPRVAKKLPTDVLAFALVHEFAHLHLHHIAPLDSGSRPAGVIRQRELEADRFAARFWATNDTRVAKAAAAAFLSPVAQRAFGSELRETEAGYPTRKERAQAILESLAETE